MSEEESQADRDERVMLSHHIDEMRADDRIRGLEAERDKLKAEVDKAYREGWLDGYSKRPQRSPRAQLGETEK